MFVAKSILFSKTSQPAPLILTSPVIRNSRVFNFLLVTFQIYFHLVFFSLFLVYSAVFDHCCWILSHHPSQFFYFYWINSILFKWWEPKYFGEGYELGYESLNNPDAVLGQFRFMKKSLGLTNQILEWSFFRMLKK